jgi:hypothetical protein
VRKNTKNRIKNKAQASVISIENKSLDINILSGLHFSFIDSKTFSKLLLGSISSIYFGATQLFTR